VAAPVQQFEHCVEQVGWMDGFEQGHEVAAGIAHLRGRVEAAVVSLEQNHTAIRCETRDLECKIETIHARHGEIGNEDLGGDEERGIEGGNAARPLP